MEKIKVIVSTDWAGSRDVNSPTPVLIIELPFPDFGDRDALAKQRTIRIVKRTMLGPVADLAQALTFLPASLAIPGFTMEMCQADVMTWHELVNVIHEAQAIMVAIDETFGPGLLVEKDDLCRDAVSDALNGEAYELHIMKEALPFWEQPLNPCDGCPNDGACVAQNME